MEIIKVAFEKLKSLKEFKQEGDELVWSPLVIDDAFGLTIFRIRATKDKESGFAILRFVVDFGNQEQDCMERRHINAMKKDLIKLLSKGGK